MKIKVKIEGNTQTTITSRGYSKQGNEMYFIHQKPVKRPVEQAGLSSIEEVPVVSEPTVEYQAEHKGAEIPRFEQSQSYSTNGDYTGDSYESYGYSYSGYADAEFNDDDSVGGTDNHVKAAKKASKKLNNNRCRKPKNDLEKIAKYRLGINLDSVDRIAEGITHLFK